MLLVDWLYALVFTAIVALVWFYVGAANPAVKPGLANQFRFLSWIKSSLLHCVGYVSSPFRMLLIKISNFRRKSSELEHMVVQPAQPVVDTHTDQLNDDNQDFADRRRYHQSQTLTASLVDIDSD